MVKARRYLLVVNTIDGHRYRLWTASPSRVMMEGASKGVIVLPENAEEADDAGADGEVARGLTRYYIPWHLVSHGACDFAVTREQVDKEWVEERRQTAIRAAEEAGLEVLGDE
jgi:hypothetical protein